MIMKSVIKESHEQLYAHKYDNWDEMKQFLKDKFYQNSQKDEQIIWKRLNLLKILNN